MSEWEPNAVGERARAVRGRLCNAVLRRRRSATVRRAMQPATQSTLLLLLSVVTRGAVATATSRAITISTQTQSANDDFKFDVTDEDFYRMPELFRLDRYDSCLSQPTGQYCVGSFELTDDGQSSLLRLMRRYSANWVDRFNHTRIHRGICLNTSCQSVTTLYEDPVQRFAECVNASTWKDYQLQAHLLSLDYCRSGAERAHVLNAPLTAGQTAFAVLITLLLVLTTLSTVYDVLLPANHLHRTQLSWAFSWSVPRSWRALAARPPPSPIDLSACDGLRVICMLCVIVEHVCWLTATSYVATPRFLEETRRAGDAMLMVNSSLVVQVFFVLSNFFLAHKLLQQARTGPLSISTLFSTLANRLVRISPAYWLIVAYAGTWWVRAGDGPMWPRLVEREAATCTAKWWAHLLYVNNVARTDEHCLIQTWYLAADTQLYAIGAVLTLSLARWGGGRALEALTALWVAVAGLQLVVAYAWQLQANLVVHRPEAVHAHYVGDVTFARLYQSPLGNAPGALAGLLVAHAHHRLKDAGVRLGDYKVWVWITHVGAPLAVAWIGLSPVLVGSGPPARLPAAALAALERPVFGVFVAVAMLGAIEDVSTPWQEWLSWDGWRIPARLSFSALLLHMIVDKTLVAGRPHPSDMSRICILVEWWGVTALSYAAALPLALLVEMPAVRLWRSFTDPPRPPVPRQIDDKPR